MIIVKRFKNIYLTIKLTELLLNLLFLDNPNFNNILFNL